MCSFGGIFGNSALQLGPKSLALSKKSFWKMPVAKSDMKPRDALDGAQCRAQQGRERMFPAYPITSQARGVRRAPINPGS